MTAVKVICFTIHVPRCLIIDGCVRHLAAAVAVASSILLLISRYITQNEITYT